MKLIAMFAIILTLSSCGALQQVAGILCNPTQDQVEAAEAGMVFALQVLDTLPQVDQHRVTLQTAVRVFDLVRNGICVTLPQLQAAIKAVENVEAKKAKAPAKPDLNPLKKALTH